METLNLNKRETMANRNTQTTQPGMLSKWLDRQAGQFEKTRFGMMAIYITIQSCLGAIAAMYVLQNHANILFVATAAALAMAGNAVFIAQGSAKLCLGMFYLNVIGNAILILANL